jgi:hypothetical protein
MSDRRATRATDPRRSPQSQHTCPRCGSRHVQVVERGPELLSKIATLYAVCGLCRTVWEAKPWQPTGDNGKEDVACATPCDNCHCNFPTIEQVPDIKLRKLLWQLVRGEYLLCHKGIPIVQSAGRGYVYDVSVVAKLKRRVCAGAFQIAKMINDRGEDWLRKEIVRVSGVGGASDGE